MELKVFFAILRCGLSLTLLLFQLIFLPIFLYFREYRRKTCFRLMFSLSICHSLQLAIHFFAPFSKIVDIALGEFIERLFGAVLNVGWDLVFLLDFLLALERLIIVIWATIFYTTNDQEPIAETIVFNILMALSWLLFLAISTLFMTPCCGYVILSQTYTFHYKFEEFPWDELIRTMEYIYFLGMQPVTFLCYLAIILLLVKEKISRQGSMQNAQSGGPRELLSRREMHILFQSGALFLLSNTPVLLSFANRMDALMEFYLTLLWIFINGANPIFYLALNADIRQNFLRMLGIIRQKVFKSSSQTNSQSSGTIMVSPYLG